MAERYPEPEAVLDDELLYDDAPRRSTLIRREERPEDIVHEGEVLAGKYRVERIPGRSGMGVLVQVRHMELGQDVTLKFLIPEACAYPEFVQRFVREARAAVKIQGEHVARVTDVGRLESGAPYMVREFLRGPDLAEVLKVRGALPIAEAVDYIVQACEGVAEGHALGVVHRNLRPTTLVVTRRSDGTPLVKVLDFAAAESLHVNPFTERSIALVGTAAILASLPYLAPEQIRDPHDVDFRADIYSLGTILHELLTGIPVYQADSAPTLLAMVAADAAPSIRTSRPDVPGDLDHLVLRCLAKNRAIRFSSVAELVLALKPFASADVASSIERVVRLGKRTSQLPPASGSRPSSSPAASSRPSELPRGPRGTLVMKTVEPPAQPFAPSAVSAANEDVTVINRYFAHGLPVDEPAPPAARAEPVAPTPPPPLRRSVPPPLRRATPPASVAEERREYRPSSTLPPPAPRSSMPGGVARSWAAPEEPAQPFLTQRRLVGLAAIAACATLGAVLAFRFGTPTVGVAPLAASPLAALPIAPAAAAPAALVAPVPVPQGPAAPLVAPAPVAPAIAASVPAPVVQPAVVAAQPPAPAAVAVAPAQPVPVAVQPAPVAAQRPVAPRPALPKPKAAPPEAVAEATTRKPIVAAAAAAPGGGLFDEPR